MAAEHGGATVGYGSSLLGQALRAAIAEVLFGEYEDEAREEAASLSEDTDSDKSPALKPRKRARSKHRSSSGGAGADSDVEGDGEADRSNSVVLTAAKVPLVVRQAASDMLMRQLDLACDGVLGAHDTLQVRGEAVGASGQSSAANLWAESSAEGRIEYYRMLADSWAITATGVHLRLPRLVAGSSSGVVRVGREEVHIDRLKIIAGDAETFEERARQASASQAEASNRAEEIARLEEAVQKSSRGSTQNGTTSRGGRRRRGRGR